ncbi:MAG: DHHA1 domain-containing protein, partial [Halobacteria archaeon]|nr:DHHA1 domain-containing protein [Halobacteria archaeon]
IQEMGTDTPQNVNTGLLHGIRTETMYFRHDTSPADLTAAAYLYPFADHSVLEQLESPSMSPEELDILAESIRNREVRGSYLVSNVGFINNTEALTRAAEHLLNLEGISTTVVFGIAEGNIYIAARSKDVRVNIADALQAYLDDSAEVYGHSTEANASVPLGIFGNVDGENGERDTLLELVDEAVSRKILGSVGVEEEES